MPLQQHMFQPTKLNDPNFAGGFVDSDSNIPFGAPFSYNIPPTTETKESNTAFGVSYNLIN